MATERYIDNLALVDEKFNMQLHSGNAVHLNGTDQNIDLDIDNLGDDMFLTFTHPDTQKIEMITF